MTARELRDALSDLLNTVNVGERAQCFQIYAASLSLCNRWKELNGEEPDIEQGYDYNLGKVSGFLRELENAVFLREDELLTPAKALDSARTYLNVLSSSSHE